MVLSKDFALFVPSMFPVLSWPWISPFLYEGCYLHDCVVQWFPFVCPFEVTGIVLTMDFPPFSYKGCYRHDCLVQIYPLICIFDVTDIVLFKDVPLFILSQLPALSWPKISPLFVQRMLPAWLSCSRISPCLYFRCYRHCLVQGCPLVYAFDVPVIFLSKDFPLFVPSMLPALSCSRMSLCLYFRSNRHYLVKGCPLVCT